MRLSWDKGMRRSYRFALGLEVLATCESTHKSRVVGSPEIAPMLSSKMMTGASALRLCSHVPVFDVPKTLARVGQRSDAQSLHEPALRIQVVAEIQEHDRNLFRDRLEHRRVELTARGLVERSARGLEVPIDRQGGEPRKIVAGVVHLGRGEERVRIRIARHRDLDKQRVEGPLARLAVH